MRNVTKTLYFHTLENDTATSTAVVTTTGVDTAGYDSIVGRLTISTGTTSHTLHAEMSPTTATGDFVDIEGSEVIAESTGTRDLFIEVFQPQQRYVRFVFTPSASVIVENFTAILKGTSLPVTNDVDGTQEGVFLASPSSGTA